MADIGWRRRRGSSPAARGGARQRAGLPPASASNTLSCQRETLHSQQLKSIKKSIDSDHGIYRYCEGREVQVETSPSKFSTSGRVRGRAAGGLTLRLGASLSDEAGASDRAVSGGRRAR